MRRYSGVLLLVATSLACSPGAMGQGFRASIVGRVTDESGAVVPETKITATNMGTNESRSAVVGETGDFALLQLAPGTYMVTAEHEGFNKELRRGIVLETNQELRLEIVLKVGLVTQQVEVTAAAPLIASENAALGNVVDQKKIVELPLNGRDYLQLAQLQPNVFAPAQGSNLGFRGGFNVAGNSEIANNFLLDGIDNNDETTNQPSHRPILDAVREFKVLTGSYSAEYGRQAGGQIIVTTKSGTNQFHGSLWEFHRNAPLDARNFFAPEKPPFRRNQFGGVIGGPIRRDRSFFFAGYEGQRRGQQEASLAKVPSLANKRGDFSGNSANGGTGLIRDPLFPVETCTSGPPRVTTGCFQDGGVLGRIPQSRWTSQGAGLLALFPDPNRSGSQNFQSAKTGRFSIDQFSVRTDHRLREKDNLFTVYEFADSTEFFPLSNPLCSARDVPGWGCDETQRTQHAILNWTHVFSPRLINEARIGYSRFGFYRLQEDRNVDVVNRLGIGGLTDAGKTPFNNGAPQLSVTGYAIIGGPTNLPQGRHDNTYHYIENMTFVTGKHTLKWGLDIRRFLFNSFFTSFGRGSFQFNGMFTGDPVADLLLGMPRQADRNIGEPFHNAMTFSSGYYLTDNWKLTPKLTLDLGLRYELNLPPVERVNKMASFDPSTGTLKLAGGREALPIVDTSVPGLFLKTRPRPDVGRRLWETNTHDFAPRVGVAWRPFGGTKTVLRAGFGIYYNYQIVGNGITPLSRNSPFRLRQTAGPFSASARPNLADVFSSGTPSTIPPGIQEDFKTAYTEEWSFGVERELAQNLVLDASYLGSQSHKLPVPWNINQALPPSPQCLAQPTPPPQCTLAARRPFPAYGNITGGFVSSIGNANFNALQLRAERRFNRGLSLVSSYTWSKAIDENDGISAAADADSFFAQNARNLSVERGPASYDVTHRWVFSYVYDLPFGKGGRFASHISALNAVIGGWRLTGILTLQSGRPFTVVNGSTTDLSATGGTSDRPNLIGDWHVANPTPDRWFNTCTLSADGLNRTNCRDKTEAPAWQLNALGTFGNAGRNIIRADGLKNFDFGLDRDFRLTERFNLEFRSEFFNLPNHPNFFLPNANAIGGSFGSVSRAAFQSQTGAQRQIQFGLKLAF